MTALPPGSTIGILGGGQLGRMLSLAAARLGFKTHIYAPEADGPAFDFSTRQTIAGYDDQQSLAAFASSIAVATYEFENVPAATVEFLSARVPVRPGAKALACAQDRLNEKQLAQALGAGTAPFAQVDSLTDLEAAIASIGCPAVLKTRRFGYDGKGQAKIYAASDAAAAWEAVGGQACILEGFINFSKEVSVVAARGEDGTFRAFDVTENDHRNHILYRSLAPAYVSYEIAQSAVGTAEKIAAALDYVGVFAVEYFVSGDGSNARLLVNEMAPRVHNSGHWTLDGADTSQFEQHIRAVAGWPLGSTSRRAPQVEMINMIGDEITACERLAAEPGTQVHHYGKAESRAGRKMGHFTRLLSHPAARK